MLKSRFYSFGSPIKVENYKLMDCQVYNPILKSLGCRKLTELIFVNFKKVNNIHIPVHDSQQETVTI
jgi:leucyl/phenylalanyl-tRNA--protein transferase